MCTMLFFLKRKRSDPIHSRTCNSFLLRSGYELKDRFTKPFKITLCIRRLFTQRIEFIWLENSYESLLRENRLLVSTRSFQF